VLDGALGLDLRDGRVFHQVAFPPGAARQVLDAFAAAGLSPCVYVDRPGVDLVVGDQPSTHPDHLTRARPWVAVDDLHRVVEAEPVYAFAVVGRPAALLGPVPRLVGPAGSASVVGDLIYGGSTVQVRPPKVSKWSGVLAFCAERGLDPARVLAVGDGANDLELLEGAAVACAVATATPALLARADHVIGPPASGGWAAVLDMVGRPVSGR
jgi:haloacid dehalogenase-like hydrolase